MTVFYQVENVFDYKLWKCVRGLFSFQLHINGRKEIEVLVNGDLMEFDEQFIMDFVGVIIIKYNNTSRYSIIFESGIALTVEEVEGILQMMLLVPPVFKGGFAISLLLIVLDVTE